jgi:hypothetical protein
MCTANQKERQFLDVDETILISIQQVKYHLTQLVTCTKLPKGSNPPAIESSDQVRPQLAGCTHPPGFGNLHFRVRFVWASATSQMRQSGTKWANHRNAMLCEQYFSIGSTLFAPMKDESLSLYPSTGQMISLQCRCFLLFSSRFV